MMKPQVKNRAPAPIQITAEQLLREARERGLEDAPRAPKQYIADSEELRQYQQGKRKDFEDQIRRQRHLIGLWCKYGLWEASQKEFERARSVFERALDVDYRNQTIWFKYAEMEMKNKFINHARNIWDRAVALLPRVDTFWYKYSYMEEMVGAIEEARQVFERWMKWEPDDMGWGAYIKFEMRQGNISRARALYERYTEQHQTCRAYLKYARWEERHGDKAKARAVYERSMIELPVEEQKHSLLVSFARFEERCKEFERAKVIFQFALEQAERMLAVDANDKAAKENKDALNAEMVAFEKRHGNRKDIEDVIVKKRRDYYEQKLEQDSYDYDSWFDLARLEEAEGNFDKVREVYERAISNSPPIPEKRFWRRYIYLWISYAIFEELQTSSIDRARSVYRECLRLIPHKEFTFGKIWLMAAQLEVRQKDLSSARKLLGQAIGMCPKESLFKGYINLELQLGEVDRCRSIYGKYLEFMPSNCQAWLDYARLEVNVGELERARAIYSLAVSQPTLDMPEVLWKAYIDFEIEDQQAENVRALYASLLERTSHVKVWIACAQFEASELGGGLESMRKICRDGYDSLKSQGLKEERVMLLETWRDLEAESKKGGGDGDPAMVESKMPKKIKMRRMATAADGSELGWEEYYDYHFPDDDRQIKGMKILENAMKWKQMMASASGSSGDDSSVLGKRKEQHEQADQVDMDPDSIDIDDDA